MESIKKTVSHVVLDPRNPDTFRELNTEYRQNAYIREQFGLIEPKERYLAESGEFCYDVPLLESLQAMLKCKVVYDSVSVSLYKYMHIQYIYTCMIGSYSSPFFSWCASYYSVAEEVGHS